MAIYLYERKCTARDPITIRRSFTDVFSGLIEPFDITLPFSNADGYFSDLIQSEEIRGQNVTLSIYDEGASVQFQVIGAINNISFSNQGAEAHVSITVYGDPALHSILPAQTYTTDDWTDNQPTEINPEADLGRAYPIVFGYAKKVKGLYVHADYTNDYYDYILCKTGSSYYTESDNSNKDTTMTVYVGKVIVDSSLFTMYDGSQSSPYPGYAFIRFTGEQRSPQGQPLEVYADFRGLVLTGSTATRNGATILEALLNDSDIGLNQSVNSASFTNAETVLTDLLFDFALEEQRSDHITNLLNLMDASLQQNEDGEYEIQIDTENAVISGQFGMGADNQFSKILGIHDYRLGVDLKEAPQNLIIKYRYDPWTDKYKQSQSKFMFTFGKAESEIIETPYIRDHETVDRIIGKKVKKRTLCDNEISLQVGMDGRMLEQLSRIELNISTLGINSTNGNDQWQIQSIDKNLSKFDLICRPYDDDVYVYSASSLPADEYPDDIPDYSATAPDAPDNIAIESSGVDEGEDGILSAYWVLSCDEPADTANFSHIVFGYKPQGASVPYAYIDGEDQEDGTWQGRISGLSTGKAYDLVVRSVNAFNLKSTGDYLLNQTSAGDSGAPAQVTGVTGKTSKGKTWYAEWTKSSDSRVTKYHVQWGNSGFGSIYSEKYVALNCDSFTDNTRSYGSLYIRVKAVTRAGVESSSWSSTGAATTSKTDTVDIEDEAVDTDQIASLAVTNAKVNDLSATKIDADVLRILDGTAVSSSYGGDKDNVRTGRAHFYTTGGTQICQIGTGSYATIEVASPNNYGIYITTAGVQSAVYAQNNNSSNPGIYGYNSNGSGTGIKGVGGGVGVYGDGGVGLHGYGSSYGMYCEGELRLGVTTGSGRTSTGEFAAVYVDGLGWRSVALYTAI